MKNLQTVPDSPRSVFSIPSGLSSALPTAGHQMQRSAISLHTFPTILTSSRSRIPSRLCSILFSDRLSLLLPKNRICPTLSPLRLRVVSSGLVEKVLLLGSKSFSGPIGARNSTPCLHLRHKCKRLARLSELKRLHLLGVRSGSSDYRALLHTSPTLSIPASLTWSASWTNSTPTSPSVA